MRPIERLIKRIKAGMNPEAAYGIEYHLLRRDEGFTGNTWTQKTGIAYRKSQPTLFDEN